MRKNEPITHIMTQDVESVQVGQALSTVFNLMRDSGIHHVPVLDGTKLAGLISFTDMMRLDLMISGIDEHAINAIMDQQFNVADVMSTDVVTLKHTEVIRDAVALLGEGSFHSLPVIDESGDLKGMVTSTDLIRYLGEQY